MKQMTLPAYYPPLATRGAKESGENGYLSLDIPEQGLELLLELTADAGACEESGEVDG